MRKCGGARKDILVRRREDRVFRDKEGRILLAEARELGRTLVTRDARPLEYDGRGHARVMGC